MKAGHSLEKADLLILINLMDLKIKKQFMKLQNTWKKRNWAEKKFNLSFVTGLFQDRDIGEHRFRLFIVINAVSCLCWKKSFLLNYQKMLNLEKEILLQHQKNLLRLNVQSVKAKLVEKQTL